MRCTPVSERCRPAKIPLVAERDDRPVAQQETAVSERPQVAFFVNLAGRADLPEQLRGLLSLYAEQVRRLSDLHP